MERLIFTHLALSVYKNVQNSQPPNRFKAELINKYSDPVSKLAPSQQKKIYEITRLAYKAGVQDAINKYEIN